jgi:hypothetical protein
VWVSTYCYYLEGGGDAVALLVKDECAILHAASGKETNVTRAGEFLWRFAGIVICGWDSANRANDVEVVCDERFVGDEKEEGEFFEDGDLGDFGIRDYLLCLLAAILGRDVLNLLSATHEGCRLQRCKHHNLCPLQP